MTTIRLALALLALFAAPALAGERVLRFATEAAYPPFNSQTADGRLEGFDIDIGNALCAQMKARCEWVVQDWDGMIPALQAGKFDAVVASMFITLERGKQVDFTQPYYRTPAAFVALKSTPLAGVSPADLAGKSVGVQGSSVYATYVERLLPDSAPKEYTAVPDMLADLANGRVDAVNDDLVVLDQFLKSPEGACCKLVAAMEPLPDIHGPGAGVATRKGDPLRDELNAALDAVIASGAYRAINARHFAFDLSPGKN